MVEAARLSVVVDADTRALQAGVRQAHDAIHGFGAAASSALTGAASAGTSFLGAISKIGIGVFGLQQLGGAIGSVATGMVSGNAQMETYETQLGTLLGSADKAKERLAELAKFGAETPFELPEVVRAEKVLLGFGLTGQKAVEMTGKSGAELRTVIGDIAAGTGASFEEIALNFGKFSAGATGESISRLQELGVVTREQMTAMGIEFSKAGELISPLPQAMEVAVKIAQQKFGGGMNALSKTFAGQMSTLADNFNQAKNVVTQPIFDVLKTAVAGLNDLLSSGGFQATLQRVAQLLAGAVQTGVDLAGRAFAYLRDAIPPLVDALGAQLPGAIAAVQAVLGPLAERIATFFSSLAGGATLATTVNRAFGDLIPAGLNPILDAVDGAFKRVKETVGGLVATIQGGGLAALWAQVQAAMADFAPTGERIGSAITAITAAVSALVPEPIKTFVAQLLATGESAAAGESPLKLLAGAVNAVSGAVAAAIGWLKDNEVVLYAVAGAATAVAAALAIQEGVQLAVTVATTAATAAQWLLNAALTANPIGIVVVALGALAGALIYAYTHSETFRKVVDDTFAVLKDAVTVAIQVSTGLIDDFALLLDALGRTMDALARTASVAFAGVTATIRSAWSAVSAATTSTWTEIMGFLEPLWATMQETVATVFGAIQTVAAATWGAVQATITAAMSNAQGAVEARLNAIKDFFEGARAAIEGIVNAIRSTVENVFGSLINTANDAKNQMHGILDTVRGWLDAIRGMVAAARDIFASRPSGPSGGGGGGGPGAPAMPGGPSEPAPPEPPPAGVLRPVPSLGAMGFASQTTVIQVVLPAGLMVGTAAEVARVLQPELERIVAVRR